MRKELTNMREKMAAFLPDEDNTIRLFSGDNESEAIHESPMLHALILHEDLQSGFRAKRVLDRLEGNADVKPRFMINLWRFDMMADPRLMDVAVEDAKHADIVIIALHGKNELPDSVRQWFSRGIMNREGEPCALVVSFNAGVRESIRAKLTMEGLRAAATAVGIEVFQHFDNAPTQNWIHDIPARETRIMTEPVACPA